MYMHVRSFLHIIYIPTSDVLVWTNEHIQQWVNEIGLGDHAHCLNETGVHGGVVALDNDMDHEKLALALQIPLSNFEVCLHVHIDNTCSIHVHLYTLYSVYIVQCVDMFA